MSSLRSGTLLCAVSILIAASVPASADVTIHCLDVGQGDATLIQSSSGQTLLFDGGDSGKGTAVVVPYMTSLGLDAVDYMVASHYHADHISGLIEVYHQKGVAQKVYDRGWSYTTATYSTYASLVSPQRYTITDGQVIDLGDGVTVTCVAVNGNGRVGSPYNDSSLENEYGVALLVECGDFDFFVAGDLIGINSSGHVDIESSVGAEVGPIEVYQVDHHGSYTSSNASFLASTQPEVAIISVGSNSYGHPTQEVLNRLVSYGAFVYQTEAGSGGTLPPEDLDVVNGDIVITTDGYGEYYVNGDEWTMDEPDVSPVQPTVPAFAILGNVPNPFNPLTRISFTTPRGGPAHLSIYDLTGREVHALSFTAEPGEQSLVWNGRDDESRPVPSGMYVYRIRTPDGVGSGRMSLLK